MFKKFVLCLFAAAIASHAYADIIELDAVNPDNCRQQILHSVDSLPVIATYTSNSNDDHGISKQFMEKFEILAKSHPERTFFKWNEAKDKAQLTKSLCLQQLGNLFQPNIILVGITSFNGGQMLFMSAPIRLQWAGEMTIMEMNKFIDLSDSSTKKSIFSQKKGD